MRRLNKSSTESANAAGNGAVLRATEAKWGPMKLMGMFVSCLMILSVLFSITVVISDLPSEGIWGGAHARVLVFEQPQNAVNSEEETSLSTKVPEDKLLSGLLTTDFDEKTCLSRYQSSLYGHPLTHTPSSHLISKLRSYETLHKKCGPHTEPYRKALELLKSGKRSGPSDCNYLVWISYSGLGNRILTLASAFLYALVTDRVLLVDRGKDIADLFCEPFPEASWLLPEDFPLISQFEKFDQKSAESYGNMLKSNVFGNVSDDMAIPASLYLHLGHDYDDQDKLFFCEQDQDFFKKVPWLIMKTDNYFIPSLFLIPSFEQELSNLFPEKQTVFHFLGRYLFHPTNQVWGLVTRFYQAYLSKADEKIGVQIRVFDTRPGPFQYVFDQILGCLLDEKILPETTKQVQISSIESQVTKAVLITSLNSGYLEQLRDLYWENPTKTGEIISFFQPSHEQYQQTEKQMHNMKAWAEMYLLSLTDKLVTSSWSTFGYVAQGLGGLKPWILYKPENQTTPNPPCQPAMSMEPCFHAPPFFDCKRRTGVDTGLIVPHVRHCEDMSWGLKLVDGEK